MAGIERIYIAIGALSLTAAAMLSAYGFHGLSDVLSAQKLASWAWAVDMQYYHSLGLILVGILGRQLGQPILLRIAGALMIIGMLVFSGLIYAESLGAPEAIGEIVPMGGTAFMLAWLAVAVGVWRAWA
jgi:uncharacterized membrane protein YgdD (TMEM256/DUF423 family)